MKLFLCLALALVTVNAKCTENCNGNGNCVKGDKCECYSGFQGVSCADRTCQKGHPWIGDHDTYTECSSKGTCNRKDGTCECYDGFEGTACQRMSCVNDCSGHGQCLTQNYFFSDANAWDQTMIQGCSCDPGFQGLDCSERMCHKGDDPLTEGNVLPQIQKITISLGDNGAEQQVILGFTSLGTTETHFTWAMQATSISPISIKEALEALPNQVVPSVTVEYDTSGGATTDTSRVFKVTFDDPMNSGDQNMLTVVSSACTNNGCATISNGINGGGSTSVTVHQSAGSDNEASVCSNRGTCDTETGLCVCFNGYKGIACQKQSIFN